MRQYSIVYDRTAIADMAELQAWIARQSSERIASGYLKRVRQFCRRLRHFPHRGVLRNDIRPGVRIMGFEGRVDVAFEIAEDRVIIVRVLYAGRQFDSR